MNRTREKEKASKKGARKEARPYEPLVRINYYFRPSWSNICANRKSRRASGPSRFARPIILFANSLRNEASQPATATTKREETIAILFIAAVKARWEITIVGLSATASIHDAYVVRQFTTAKENRNDGNGREDKKIT